MRSITRIAMLLFVASIVLLAFRQDKCDHVFTNVVQPEVSAYTGSNVLTIWPSGKQEGQELICVKCFHRQKQVVDYGNEKHYTPIAIPESLRSSVSIDTCNMPIKTLFVRGVE